MFLETLHCFSGAYNLERYPPPAPQQPLLAWDAADEYLLNSLASLTQERQSLNILIVNDQFGALAVALHAFRPHSWGDSFTARLALAKNLSRNGLPDDVTFIPAISVPPGNLEDPADEDVVMRGYDVVLWRVPKMRALFEQQRTALGPLLRPDTLVLVGGMVKHLPESAKDVLSHLGSVKVYPVQKKAVLLQVTPDPRLPRLHAEPEAPLFVPEYELELTDGPNVFSRGKFDAGAHFFLDQFAQLPKAKRIADLGCGNGTLGIVAKRLQPGAELHFFDESYQAVASAEINYQRNVSDTSEPMAQFHVDDGLTHYAGEAFDLVLCNPPFHQGHVIDDRIALRMFEQSKQHLRIGGELWIIGNRHLGYHVKLRQMFGNCRQIAAHPKFVVLAAAKY